MNLFSGMYFFLNTYLAWTLSVRIHTLSLLLSAQIIHGFTLRRDECLKSILVIS